jgi:hypothetical protein
VEVAEAQVSECSTVRLQFIRHDLEWPNALVPEELSHEFQGGPFVSALLNQDVEYFAFTIHGAPQVHLLTTYVHENFVNIPMIKGSRTAFADSVGIGLSEFQHPQTNRLIGDIDFSLHEKILNIPASHRKTEIEPNGLSNNVGVEAVASIRGFLHRRNLSSNRSRPRVNLTDPRRLTREGKTPLLRRRFAS